MGEVKRGKDGRNIGRKNERKGETEEEKKGER